MADNTAATVSMKSGGYYSQSTRGAKDVIDNAANMLLDAVDALPEIGDTSVITISDFGAADGGTSRSAIYKTVQALRSRFPKNQIQIIYTDLASNDFSTLFKNVQGLQEQDEINFFLDFDNIFIHACGIGFHRQLHVSGSLDIGFSATAMHYVSQKPCEITDHVHMVGASGAELEAFSTQAATDWDNILLARALELRPGGRLVFLNFGKDEQGRYLGNTGGANMFDTFHRLWKGLLDEGKISPVEYERATFPQFYRTPEEFCAPLKDKSSAVYAAGLRLITAHTGLTPCPYRAAFDASNGQMNTRDFAISYVPTLRSWSETVFANALDTSRGLAERNSIIDLFYQRYEDLVAENPTGHAMDYIHCYLAIEKV